jgi:hypothetical protein
MTVSTTLITRQKDLTKAIKDISVTGKKLDLLIQTAGVACVYQSIKNGNTTPATDLIAAMPKGSRVKALVAFMVQNGHLKYQVDAKTGKIIDDKVEFSKEKGLKWDAPAMIATMDKKPWWEHKHNDETPKPFDLKKSLSQQLKRAKAAQEDESEVEHKMTDEEYAGFVKYCASVGVTI